MRSSSVEDHCSSHYSHAQSPRHVSPAWSSADSSGNLSNEDDDTHCLPPPSAVVGLQDAHEIVANCQKMLQEWNKRCGPVAKLRIRAANGSLKINKVEPPTDFARGELMVMVKRGREAILQLKSIAFLDLQSIQANDLSNFWASFWVDAINVVDVIHERIAHASSVLQ
jgi:hypothetical protein